MRAQLPILGAMVIALSRMPASAQPATAGVSGSPTEMELRAWVSVLSKRPTSQTYEAYSAAIAGLYTLDRENVVIGEAWLDQVLKYLLEIPDDARRADAFIRLRRASTQFARVELPVMLNFLVAQKNSSDPRVARTANEFLDAYLLVRSDTLAGTLRSYLSQVRDREPSWKVVRLLYEPDPDKAMEELAESKFNRGGDRVQPDSAIRAGFVRDRKEVEYLLVSWNQAQDANKFEWRDKIVDKLSSLANHPEWFVRAYAAVILLRESRNMGNPTNSRLEDPALVTKLRQDSNPFVAEVGREISPQQP